MTWQNAQRIFHLLNELSPRDEALVSLRNALFKTAARYAHLRTDWQRADVDERRQMDRSRTMTHDGFIDACNVVSREVKKRGLDISWKAELGKDRKQIGDFACYIHCLLGLEVR